MTSQERMYYMIRRKIQRGKYVLSRFIRQIARFLMDGLISEEMYEELMDILREKHPELIELERKEEEAPAKPEGTNNSTEEDASE